MVRYYGLYANAHRGKVGKADRVPVALGMIEEEPTPVPSKGWAEMIRKVYEVDPLICPRCGGRMKVVAFLTEYAVVDRIIRLAVKGISLSPDLRTTVLAHFGLADIYSRLGRCQQHVFKARQLQKSLFL
jgi:hypothetical protein